MYYSMIMYVSTSKFHAAYKVNKRPKWKHEYIYLKIEHLYILSLLLSAESVRRDIFKLGSLLNMEAMKK